MQLQVGVKIFLKNDEGKFLLLKRSSKKYINTKGNWDIVGGRIDSGTKLLENLNREVYEETQLKILSEPILVHAQDIILGEEKHVVRLSYIGTTKGEVILDTEENTEYKWLSVDEMKAQEDLDIYVKEILEKDLIENL